MAQRADSGLETDLQPHAVRRGDRLLIRKTEFHGVAAPPRGQEPA